MSNRLLADVDQEFFKEFTDAIPWGSRSNLLEGLARIALRSDKKILWDIIADPKNCRYVIEKEKESEPNRGLGKDS